MSQVQDYNMLDFTGGLNLREDAFELKPGESPEMVNVDLDRDGGFVSRKGWTKTNAAAVAGWDPRSLFVHELADGTDNVYLANDTLHYSTNDGVTWSEHAAYSLVADPHEADFAPWGDTAYMVRGSTLSSCSLDSAAAITSIAQAETGTWSAYASPTTAFPFASFVASHAGYMFAAFTEEDATVHQHRLRWSHPNDPEAWLEDDYIDIQEGGGPITGLVPMDDHLLIFKPSSIWALYGYDAASWQLVRVSHDVGAPHRQAIARSESSCYFYSHPRGLFQITSGRYPIEISRNLKSAFESADFASAYTDNIWLGWMAGRLWCAVPYDTTTAVSDASVVFVYDPALRAHGEHGGQVGVWTSYKGQSSATDTLALGPFAQGGYGGGERKNLACIRGATGHTVLVDDNEDPVDDLAGTEYNVVSYYVTHWLYMGQPGLKKRWRRPDFIVKERTNEWDLAIDIYVDFDEASAKREYTIVVPAGPAGALWGSFNWGDGTLYGGAAKGSVVQKGGNIGPAKAVQLNLAGEPGLRWGVDGIVFKYTPRRMR